MKKMDLKASPKTKEALMHENFQYYTYTTIQ